MGIRTKGFTFNLRKKVGDLIFYTGKGGQQIVRSYVPKVNDKKSEGQIAQRERQTSLLRLFQLFKAGIKNAYAKKKKTLTDYNEFIKLNSEVFAESVDWQNASVWGATVLLSPNLAIRDDVQIVVGPDTVNNLLVAQVTFQPSNPNVNSEGTQIQLNMYNPGRAAGRSVSYTTRANGAANFYVKLEEYNMSEVQYATAMARNPRTGDELHKTDMFVSTASSVTIPSGATIL